MALQHARAGRRIGVTGCGKRAGDGLDACAFQSARAQQGGAAVENGDDGGFHTHRTGAAIEDEVELVAEAFADMARRGRADAAGRVGARGDERATNG